MFKPVYVHVYNDRTTIQGALSDLCIQQLRFETSYAVPGAFFSKAYQKHAWDGRKHLFRLKDQSFPTGLLSRVRQVFLQHNLTYQVVDHRISPKSSLSINFKPPFPLREYQQQAVTSAPKKQRGIIRISTGGGKSVVAAGIVGTLQVPTLVLVHKRDIFWQLIQTLTNSLDIPIGQIGAGKWDPQPVSVAMIQTVARLFDPKLKLDDEWDEDCSHLSELRSFIQTARCIIVDECHHLQLGQYSTVLSNCPQAFYRFGLSATPFRSDQADIVIEAYTAPKFVDIGASYLIQSGYLANPTIYMVKFKHSRQPSTLTYQQLYKQEVVESADRNQLITNLALKATQAGKTVLVAVTRIEHGQTLESILKTHEPTTLFVSGDTDSQIRQQALADLNTGARKVVIATTVFGEGVDVPNLDVLVNAKAAESAVDSLQLAGRALRRTPTKTHATIVDIMDVGCRFLEKHSSARMQTYQLEPSYAIREVGSPVEVTFI